MEIQGIRAGESGAPHGRTALVEELNRRGRVVEGGRAKGKSKSSNTAREGGQKERISGGSDKHSMHERMRQSRLTGKISSKKMISYIQAPLRRVTYYLPYP